MAISFYLRKFGTSSFVEREKQFLDEKIIPIKTDAVAQTQLTFCPEHKEWEKVSVTDNIEDENDGFQIQTECGQILSGFPIEIPKVPDENKNKIRICKNELESLQTHAEGLRKIPQETLSDYLSQTLRLERLQTENDNFYDDMQCKKDLFGFQLYTDEKRRLLELTYFMLDRKIVDSNLFNPKATPPVKKYAIKLRMTEFPSIYIPSDHGTATNLWGEVQKCKDKEIIFNAKLPQSAKNQIHKMMNIFAGREISLNTVLDGEEFLRGICEFPYEPNLLIVDNFKNKVLSDMKTEDKISSDVYNKACEWLQIRNFPTLRKLFYKNPPVLLLFKKLLNLGFKDLNIITSILSDSDSMYLFDLGEMSLNRFVSFLLEGHPEKTVWTMLKKNLNDAQLGMTELDDGIDMFHQYFNYIEETTKKSIMKDGMTLYNHDLLAKLSLDIKNKNVEFFYTAEQLTLEDEIDDYKFQLAKNSEMLRELGSKLHNCVASYTQRIVSGNCIIVFAHVEGELKLCIEVRGNIVWQQRADRNSNPVGKDALALKKWEEKHNLVFINNRI
ncbi:MAG: PcfJ domain-containing protein [Treponemataceae bacterium]|nr:PcfJ domain-containing protein [Treponemataceae bacterium]